MQASFPARNARALALTTLCTALLTACGGGGSSNDASTGASATTSADTATTYAANATLVASDATAALDTGVVTAQAAITAQAAANSAPGFGSDAVPPLQEALAISPAAVANVPVACPGGGNATLTISGSSAVGVLNGKLDTGEAYQIVFTDCKSSAGAAAVNGALTMTVDATTATSLSLSMVATDLGIALPNGAMVLSGSAARQVSSTLGAGGATQLSSRVTTPNLTLTTHYNARTSNFALSAVDVTRQSTWLNGLPQSSSMSGAYTLAATLVNGAFTCTVGTQGSVSYSAAGVPVSGNWAVALPKTAIAVSVADSVATVTVDDGRDGTIERTLTLPIGKLQAEAG